jgi:hypothetical protein
MIITEDPRFNEGRWEMYVPRKIFEVSTGDGEKTIYVKFVDKAGNESPVFTGKVTYDSTPPAGSEFKIDNLAEFTNNTTKTVAISVQAKEAKEMRIAQKGFSQGVWEPFASSKTITLDGDDGEKELAVFFRDEAGNVSDPLVARIILDRTPPLPVDITIDNGAGWTNHTEKKVTLQLNVRGADEMMLSNNASFEGGEWIPFKDSVTDYVLPGEDGEKIIFVKFRDKAGNISPTLTGKINLKRSF